MNTLQLSDINWELLAPIAVLQLTLIIVAVIDFIRNKETNGPRLMWLFIILFIQIIGPILYFIIGRKQS